MTENKPIMPMPAAHQQLMFAAEMRYPPVLSIAIPTYKRFSLLKEALASVFALEFSIPVEILIVDNDPEKPELAMAEMEEFQGQNIAYYKNHENLGMFSNWNQCLSLAKGKYITLLHDDDVLLPEFARQINVLLKQGSLGHEIVSFSVDCWDLRADRPEEKNWSLSGLKKAFKKCLPGTIYEVKGVAELFFYNPFCGTLGIVMNRRKALSLQGFDKSWYPIADYEFWCRWVCLIGSIPFVRKPVGRYRIQQNESLRLDVRKGFVSGSTALRRRMIAQHGVPPWLNHMVGIVAWFQEKSINLEWRTHNEPDPIFFRWIGLRLWRKMVDWLCFFLRKTQVDRGFS
jgi:glycosyltransferase involved in cell wall biosynthesis